ncbi:hypothetical protein KZ483_01470 [Paenibacillus sp. sptzw28]|nr:hypothetical protein [Paenibacillus sp. sptzw28]QYR21743.1 hypothetical protein KZ483_01470 [Paenibacillus sp. sptzw28]
MFKTGVKCCCSSPVFYPDRIGQGRNQVRGGPENRADVPHPDDINRDLSAFGKTFAFVLPMLERADSK